MRTYGRIPQGPTFYQWVEVDPDENRNNDSIYLTTFIQCLKLVPGESPFYANVGIPAHQTVVTQLYPDYYVQQLQRLFAPYFASLIVTPTRGADHPSYDVQCVFKSGARITVTLVPQVLLNARGEVQTDGFGKAIVVKLVAGRFVPI